MGVRNNGQHKYTNEEDEWLKKHIDDLTYPELTRQFNSLFGTSVKNISDHCIKTLNLNKKINRGDFKKGERGCKNTLPIGAESWDGLNLYVKIADNVNDCSEYGRMPLKREDPNWRRKDYIVWEEHGNIAPQNPNEMLVHLNRDKRDCDINNLYKTTRTINLFMAKNGWYTEDRELTLAGIKWCELFYAMKGLETND